jgi:NAD(P)-dependent dehydrogenase (short-subunit alcohol dehydrogenase family)
MLDRRSIVPLFLPSCNQHARPSPSGLAEIPCGCRGDVKKGEQDCEAEFVDFRRRHRRRLRPWRGHRQDAGIAWRQSRAVRYQRRSRRAAGRGNRRRVLQGQRTSTPEVEAAFAKSRAAIGQERILVNCAGVGGSVKTVSRDKQTREIRQYPLDNFERIIQINLIGTFRCITKSAAGMLTLAARSSTPHRSRRKTVRSGRPRIRHRRPALSG